MSYLLRSILFITILLLNFTVQAWECEEQSLPIAFLHSDIIFTGKVYDIQEGDPGEFYASFLIQQSFKDDVPDSIQVFLGKMSHSYSQAGVALGGEWRKPRDEIGKLYLIYANKKYNGTETVYLSGLCSRSIQLNERSKEKFDNEVFHLKRLSKVEDYANIWFNARDLRETEKPKPIFNLDSALKSSNYKLDSSDIGLSIIQILVNEKGEAFSWKIWTGHAVTVEQVHAMPITFVLNDKEPRDKFETFVLDLSKKLKVWIPAHSSGHDLNTIVNIRWFWDEKKNMISFQI